MKGKEIFTLEDHLFISVCKLNVPYVYVFLLTMLLTPPDFHKNCCFTISKKMQLLIFFNTMLHACYFSHDSVLHFLKFLYLSSYIKISEMSNITEFAIN